MVHVCVGHSTRVVDQRSDPRMPVFPDCGASEFWPSCLTISTTSQLNAAAVGSWLESHPLDKCHQHTAEGEWCDDFGRKSSRVVAMEKSWL